ncbi:hypothetical protein PSEEN4318 [Pseudomonas entomophila L48]|uniref:Uncharacterized protein n=1 Tax=Pseudomonas entomophila (strain L48) TaxID=384676 RepID=Q1I5T0_PSEE4|nr:hypothetical protein PSEEN4318 [Pseudomonas entomophila L48]
MNTPRLAPASRVIAVKTAPTEVVSGKWVKCCPRRSRHHHTTAEPPESHFSPNGTCAIRASLLESNRQSASDQQVTPQIGRPLPATQRLDALGHGKSPATTKLSTHASRIDTRAHRFLFQANAYLS